MLVSLRREVCPAFSKTVCLCNRVQLNTRNLQSCCSNLLDHKENQEWLSTAKWKVSLNNDSSSRHKTKQCLPDSTRTGHFPRPKQRTKLKRKPPWNLSSVHGMNTAPWCRSQPVFFIVIQWLIQFTQSLVFRFDHSHLAVNRRPQKFKGIAKAQLLSPHLKVVPWYNWQYAGKATLLHYLFTVPDILGFHLLSPQMKFVM